MSLVPIREVVRLEGYRLRLTLTDGPVIERDVSDLLAGPVFDAIRKDEAPFNRSGRNTERLSGPTGQTFVRMY